MVTLRMLSLGVALFAALLAPIRCPGAAESAPAADITIAVADFSGSDKEVGRFVADTLLTDLAQSDRLRLVERSEIGRALVELKLQSTGLTEPQQVQKVGKLIGADRLIVGSYLIRDTQLIINARLLDVRSGRVTPGGAANVTGERDNMLPLVHRLARLFHRRVTGQDLILTEENARYSPPSIEDQPHSPPPDGDDENHGSTSPQANPQEPLSGGDNVAPVRDPVESAPPLDGSPDMPITQREMVAVMTQQIGGSSGTAFFTLQRPDDPVTRIRALAAIVKATFPAPGLSSVRAAAFYRQVPDFSTVPLWGRPYLAAAIEHGLWPAQRAFHAGEWASRGFVRALLLHAPRRRAIPAIVARARRDVGLPTAPTVQLVAQREPILPEPAAYTGLIVDAHDMPVDRSMSARVLDEDGRVIYPDLAHEPDPDFVDDQGTAAYNHAAQDVARAGRNPLIVQAVRTSGDDLIVSRDTADRILEANRHNHFLWSWRVSILVDEGR